LRSHEEIRVSESGTPATPPAEAAPAEQAYDPTELMGELASLAKDRAEAPADPLFRRATQTAAQFIGRAVGVDPMDVAILLLKDNRTTLRFAHPIKLYEGKLNQFPATSSSIAGQALRAGRGAIHNDLSKLHRLSFYERIPPGPRAKLEIQKMIVVPLTAPDGATIGVLEVSRRGSAEEPAGPDFQYAQLLILSEVCDLLGRYLPPLMPENF
jgi:hypothetical protein